MILGIIIGIVSIAVLEAAVATGVLLSGKYTIVKRNKTIKK